MAILTFLVSFFNAQKYIAQCITNLKKQTNSEFLCILVDDGSRDESFEIAKKEIDGDKRFSIIKHEKKLGIGAGRATGIENTKTEYIIFMDPDDELDRNSVEKIQHQIQNQKADLFIFDYFEKKNSIDRRISGDAQDVSSLFSDSDKRISHVWHKVFRKEVFQRFDLNFCKTVTFAEDLFLCINSFLYSRNTIFVNDAYYHYVFNRSSLVNSRTEKSIYENILVVQNLLSNDFSKQKSIKSYLEKEFFHTCGLLIFPNKNNIFQFSKPHFTQWRLKNKEQTIFIPKDASIFVRLYIFLIKKRLDHIAYIFWKILKIKECYK